VRTIEPAAFTEISALGVEEQRVNVIGDFIAPAVPLGDNYQVDAEIVIEDHKDVLKVPISAVFPCDAGNCVFVVQDQRAALQPLTLGPHNVFDAAIQAGLQAGDTVIAYPEAIEAGDRVTPRSRLSR
jgi:HlyD family secretion protein